MTELAIETERLARRFGRLRAVDGVDLAVPAGAIYGFLGANGSGKTTTIRMLLGLMRPDGGHARIFGRDVRRERRQAAAQVGALLEARATYDHLSGHDNVDISRRLLRLPAAEADRVLDMVGLGDAAGRKVGHYSLGMRQRLGLARAMLGSPRLLVLDEPMNGLDPEGIADMRAAIRALPERTGATVFLSSHLLAEVEQITSHVGVMRAGRLVAQGRVGDLLAGAASDLFVRTGADREADRLLRRGGLSACASDGGLLVAGQGGEAAAARIARLLVEDGIAVHELSPRRRDLEALYLSLQDRRAA